MSSTSIADPQVAGAVAFLWSRFPKLHAVEMKQILLQGVRRYLELKIRKPHSAKMTSHLKSKTRSILDIL